MTIWVCQKCSSDFMNFTNSCQTFDGVNNMMNKLLRVSTQILAVQPKPWHFLILAIKSLTKDLIQANVCMQLRKTFQKLYNRKRCLPLKKRSLLTLPKHWKTWGMSMILACYTKKVFTKEIKAISPPALPRKRRKPV